MLPMCLKTPIFRYHYFLTFLSIVFLSTTHSRSISSDTLALDRWTFFFTGNDSSAINAIKSFDTSNIVEVPHSYNLNESYGKHKVGFGWYIKDIFIPFTNNSNIILHFGGVCLRAKVFVNGKLAGEFNDAYLPFQLNITQYIKPDQNTKIAVQVDNRLRKNDFPDVNCDGWWIYGWLTREVQIIKVSDLRLENVQVRTYFVKGTQFRAVISFDESLKKPESLKVYITDKMNNLVSYKLFKNEPLSNCTIQIGSVEAWSPENPYLYTFTIVPFWAGKKGRTFTLKRGFTQLSINNNVLILNGKPIFLRGIGRHDYLDIKRPLLSRNERLSDLVAIKKLGANILRIAHFPQDEDVYQICDSIGLLVMDEMPAWKTNTDFLADTTGKKAASNYMGNLIHEHGNFTSIVIWCIGNELSTFQDQVADYVRVVSDVTRNKDPSRLVTYASYFYQFDKSYQFIDIISINEYFGWYLGSIDMLPSLLSTIRKDNPNKPILITEFGASAAFNIRNDKATLPGPVTSLFLKDYSEDFQSLFHKTQLETIWKCRNLCSGAMVWCYNDFMEDRIKPNSKILEDGVNSMGLVTLKREPKIALHAVDTIFHQIKKEMNISGGF